MARMKSTPKQHKDVATAKKVKAMPPKPALAARISEWQRKKDEWEAAYLNVAYKVKKPVKKARRSKARGKFRL
jgi:hypothetical protein